MREVPSHALVDGKKIVITEPSVRRDLQLADEKGIDCLPNSTIFEQLTLMGKPKRKDTQVPQHSDPTDNVVDEVVHKVLGDSLVRAATTASSLEAEQDSGAKKPWRILLLKLGGEEVFVAGQNKNVVKKVVDAAQVSTAATTVTITTEEITLAQALKELKTLKPKVKGIVFQEPEEPGKPKKKVQIMLDEEVALNLQAEFDEAERLAREKAEKEQEANIALIEEWDDIQAKIDVDHQSAERLQAQEQEELSDAEKATLFQQLLEKRRQHFATKK
nr:hypothetical protein [Tanacetum cinerariifolium]